MNALWTLVPVSLASGAVMAIVFRRFSHRAAIRTATNLMLAHVLEFRLFLDEPKLVLRAQRDLLRANGRLLQAVALPIVILSILLAPSFIAMDRVYGYGPLATGKTAVITARTADADVELKSPPGVNVETPPVRAIHEREVSWRVRPVRPFSGVFQVLREGRVLKAAIVVPRPHAVVFGLPWWAWFGVFSAVSFRLFA